MHAIFKLQQVKIKIKNKKRNERVGSYILFAAGLVVSGVTGVLALVLHRTEAKK